jgi:hypothetical protein
MLSSLINQISGLGYEEKEMLLGLGAVYKLVCSILALNPSVTRIPAQDLQHTVDLVATLVRSATVQSSDEAVGGRSALSPFATAECVSRLQSLEECSVATLSVEDLQAFLNRIYLEDAINIGTMQTCAALQHVCYSVGSRDALKVLEFIAEKVVESVLSVTGGNLAYR